MSPDELISALTGFEAAFYESLPKFLLEEAFAAKAEIQNRIQKTGKNSKEVEFTPYTEAYEKKKAKILGRDVSHVDLTVSNDMWESIGIINDGQRGNVFFVTVGARDTETDKKMQGNAKKRGDFLEMTEKEKERRAISFDGKLQGLLDQFFPDNA